jgi:hypothetical protein
VRDLADQTYARLKQDPRHPSLHFTSLHFTSLHFTSLHFTSLHFTSLHFKKVGRFWSARVGAHYRAVAVEAPDGLVWFWIGSHADYDRLLG